MKQLLLAASWRVVADCCTWCAKKKMSQEPDLFDVFGDEDDSDEDSIVIKEANKERNADQARKLVAQANLEKTNNDSMKGTHVALPPKSPAITSAPTTSDDTIHDISTISTLNLPWKDPLYTGSIRLVSSLPFGGGRGYVAVQDLPPGTLVLLEQPIIAWPEQEVSSIDLERIQVILMDENAMEVVAAMESFHPTRVLVDETVGKGVKSTNPSQVEDMIQHYRKVIQEDDLGLRTILQVAVAKGIMNSDGFPLAEIDVVRMLVALRYNSLETGVYLHVAMLNHADSPNCVKFRPTQRNGYSEVRTVRRVRRGESLTISYLSGYKCHASRQQYLWKQHRFDIGVLKEDSPGFPLENVHGKLPSSADVEFMQNIETATAELEDQCRELAQMAKAKKQLSEEESETAKSIEVATQELYTSANERLGNGTHRLMLPCLVLHLDACDLVQRHVHLPKRQRTLVLVRLVTTGRKLAALQALIQPDHFDTAKTYLDIAQAIQGKSAHNRTVHRSSPMCPCFSSNTNKIALELLSESARDLFASDNSIPSNVHGWSLVESTARREHERIKKLYPHDADTYLPQLK